MNELRVIEAALFSAGAPLELEQLKDATGLTEKKIKDLIKDLIEEYDKQDTAMEIAKVGDKYAMQLKAEYANHVTKFADMEIPPRVLKTAALIAYHQPVRQRDLFDMVGYRTYDHVKALHELGLIRKRDSGRTKIITTTERFSEYFGIASTEREDIKKWLIEKLNIKLPETDDEKEKTSAEKSETDSEEESGEDISSTEDDGSSDEEKESESDDAELANSETDEKPIENQM